MSTPPEALSKPAAQDVATLAATVKGTLVIGAYDPRTCDQMWQQVRADVEAWLQETRPVPALEDKP